MRRRAAAHALLFSMYLAACSEPIVPPLDLAVEPQFVSGGDVLSPGAFISNWPFAAAIFSYSASHSFFCTGSVIEQRWVLTAGHCIDQARQLVQAGHTIIVGVGSRDMTAGMRFVPADQFLTPPAYAPLLIPANDIGLIHLTTDASTPLAPLPWQGTGPLTTVRSAGWGDTGRGFSTRLRMVTLDVLDAQPDYIFASASGASVCSGDSGGPTLDEDGILVAVNSLTSTSTCGSPAQSGHALVGGQLEWITLTTGMQPPASGGAPGTGLSVSHLGVEVCRVETTTLRATGSVAVQNVGSVATENLTVMGRIEYKDGDTPFQMLPGTLQTLHDSELAPGASVVVPFDFTFSEPSGGSPLPSGTRRNHHESGRQLPQHIAIEIPHRSRAILRPRLEPGCEWIASQAAPIRSDAKDAHWRRDPEGIIASDQNTGDLPGQFAVARGV